MDAGGWEGGDPALAPAPASSFDALDAILARLADQRLFPNLKQVVVAGHSGGGQVVQRYAIAGKGEVALTKNGIGVRYVIANPSSYAYFTAERPEPSIAASCPRYNNWKYGMEQRPPYLAALTPRPGADLRGAQGDLSVGDAGHQSQSSRARQKLHGGGGRRHRYVRGHSYSPPCRPATRERRITASWTCQTSGTTATRC